MTRPPNARALEIYRRRNEGETFVAISRDHGVTPGRVNEIYRDTIRRLRWVACESNVCPICRRKMEPSA